MLNNKKIQEAERKVLGLNYKDGLWDILMGLYFVVQSMVKPTNDSGAAPIVRYLPPMIYLVIGLVAFGYVKHHVIAPRIGMVKLNIKPNNQMGRIFIVVAIMVVITWVIFLFSANSGLGSYLANRPPWLMDVFFGLGIFLIFSMIAYSAQSPRFCLYGLLLGISLPASVIIRSEDQMMVAYPTMVAGAVMAMIGIVMLVRFIRDYPVSTHEA